MRGFFTDPKGKESNSRLTGFIVVCIALLYSGIILLFGYVAGESMVAVSAASAGYFTAVAAPVMYFLFKQKKTEEGK